ncbi:hypothetical protein EMGBD4_07940 [Verrucomicrobiota bacterium]|nr:hypothetical protein EMGBD4_07940 [Verrucomicrobiota bacterium]
MSPSSLRPARRGFTLIELMVSTALMVIIVLAVVSIAADTFKAYDRAVADLSTQSEARSVLDALENDFQTAVIRPDGRCWMEIVLPASSATGGPASPPPAVGNLNPAEHPIIMLFAAPQDRPRWRPDQTSATAPRVALKGDVCAVAYRIGQRSPFNTPGTGNQQIYGVYRTIIDSEKTFADALPIILAGTAAAPKSPWDYWSTTTPGTRTYGDYNNQKYTTAGTPLINPVVSGSSGMPWTLDDHNFLASNVVGMNLVLWCTSSLPQSTTVYRGAVALDRSAEASGAHASADLAGQQDRRVRPRGQIQQRDRLPGRLFDRHQFRRHPERSPALRPDGTFRAGGRDNGHAPLRGVQRSVAHLFRPDLSGRAFLGDRPDRDAIALLAVFFASD